MRLLIVCFVLFLFYSSVCAFFNGFNFFDPHMHQENDDESYYELFGLTRATFDENALKKAYKSLVKKYHPDHSEEPDASERFSEITQAYAVLSDPEKKRLYDTHGPDGVKMSGNTNSQQHPSGFPFDM